MFLLGALITFGWMPSATADTMTDVSAVASWSGAPYTGPSTPGTGTGLGQTETFSASFEWDVTTNTEVPNSASYTIAGPLGATGGPMMGGDFIVQAADFAFPGGIDGFVQIYDATYPSALNDNLSIFGAPGAYNFCTNCGDSGFYLVDWSVPHLAGLGMVADTGSLVVAAAPEPGSLALTLAGLATLAFMLVRTRRILPGIK